MLIFKIAALLLVSAALSLTLKKEQPVFGFLVSVAAAAGMAAVAARQLTPLLEWLQTLSGFFPDEGMGILLRVLGIALTAQLAADLCREAGMAASATSAELCGRLLALLQAVPLLQGLLDSFAGYLQ